VPAWCARRPRGGGRRALSEIRPVDDSVATSPSATITRRVRAITGLATSSRAVLSPTVSESRSGSRSITSRRGGHLRRVRVRKRVGSGARKRYIDLLRVEVASQVDLVGDREGHPPSVNALRARRRLWPVDVGPQRLRGEPPGEDDPCALAGRIPRDRGRPIAALEDRRRRARPEMGLRVTAGRRCGRSTKRAFDVGRLDRRWGWTRAPEPVGSSRPAEREGRGYVGRWTPGGFGAGGEAPHSLQRAL